MDFKYLKNEICVPNKTLYCQELSTGALREVQTVLKSAGYYNGGVDGIYGINTLNAIASFKKDSYLSRPTEIGKSTVEVLEKLGDRASVNKEEQVALAKPVINTQAGKQTGKSVMLPGNIRVHENEWIVPGIPLTWGEMTKELTRIPVSGEVVNNIIGVAKAFALIRADINLPLRINSGYRPPELKIGASKSQHKLGNAIDVCPLNGDLNRLWAVGVKSSAIGLGKGMHKGFVHLDWRKNSKRVVFSY